MAFGRVVRLCHDSRGAFPIKFTNAFLPLLLGAAVALDLSRVLVLKQKLTKALHWRLGGSLDVMTLIYGARRRIHQCSPHGRQISEI
jgi:hypothetical protein